MNKIEQAKQSWRDNRSIVEENQFEGMERMFDKDCATKVRNLQEEWAEKERELHRKHRELLALAKHISDSADIVKKEFPGWHRGVQDKTRELDVTQETRMKLLWGLR
jgi:hypothetical protein